MPSGRKKNCRKQKRVLNQKKNVTARLLAVSLIMDDYIYNNKPISTGEARKYAKEMESFRIQCHDEPHLQVVEKLISYMKTIIREQSAEEINEANIAVVVKFVEEVNEPDQTAETVCNDLGVIEQSISNLIIEDPNAMQEASTDKDNYGSVQTRTKAEYSTSIPIRDTFIEIINDNIANNKIYDIYTAKNSNKSEEVSNVNIECQNEKEVVGSGDIVYSQNMPNDFEYRKYMEIDVVPSNTNTKLNQSQGVLESPNNIKIKPNNIYNQNVITNLSQIQSNVIEKVTKQKTIVKRDNITKKERKKYAKKANKKTCNKNKVKGLLSSAQNEVEKERNLVSTIPNTPNLHKKVTRTKSITTQKKLGSSLKKNREAIDLSWVENVKYVRAIDKEEYEKIDKLEDSFWSDTSLPPNFDIKDFEYDCISIWKN